MSHPTAIAINSISGGGKTALANSLGEKLTPSQVFHFDDFDDTNVYPDDFVAWCKRGADVEEFDFPGMDETVRECLGNGDVQTIILDYPFGRLHHRFRDIITHSIYVDTTLDVALARRILRDHRTDQTLDTLKAELTTYLSSSRDVYLDSVRRYRDEADWVLDGTRDLEFLTQQILRKL
tara:strand:- start:12 stop:548 length:537 start_codon:yes stop_codon:yes gene_type:complete